MRFKKYPSLARAAEALKKRGFTEQFKLIGNRIKHLQTNRLYDPGEVAIVEYHRFLPEEKHYDRTSIVFALETIETNISGLLVSTYNTYGKVNLLEFMDKVKIKSREGNMA